MRIPQPVQAEQDALARLLDAGADRRDVKLVAPLAWKLRRILRAGLAVDPGDGVLPVAAVHADYAGDDVTLDLAGWQQATGERVEHSRRQAAYGRGSVPLADLGAPSKRQRRRYLDFCAEVERQRAEADAELEAELEAEDQGRREDAALEAEIAAEVHLELTASRREQAIARAVQT